MVCIPSHSCTATVAVFGEDCRLAVKMWDDLFTIELAYIIIGKIVAVDSVGSEAVGGKHIKSRHPFGPPMVLLSTPEVYHSFDLGLVDIVLGIAEHHCPIAYLVALSCKVTGYIIHGVAGFVVEGYVFYVVVATF